MEPLNLPDPQQKPRIVVIGGGFGGLNLVDQLDTRHYQVVLLDQYNYHYNIDDRMRVRGYDNVYAIGDVAYLTSDKWLKGHPGVAQVAIQMGERLAGNFNALAKGKPAEGFVYRDKGNLAIIGRNRAVADLPRGVHLNGFPA